MPWKETCMSDEKLRFIAAYVADEEPMTALCARFGISRDTGYRLVARYRTAGLAGLAAQSRAPHRRPRALAQAVAEAIVDLRRARPHWGPKKLLAVLRRENGATSWPAASTIGDLLRREGLSALRRRRRGAVPASQPFLPVLAPNDLWCIDFKGWFRTGDGQRCDPLTLTDAYSRLLIECRIVPPTGDGFDRFRGDFNHNRPHEALNQDTPAQHYHSSPRPYPGKIEEPCYAADLQVRRVRSNGEIKWAGEHIFISQVLTGEPVAIAETEDGDWRVQFADIELGIIDRPAVTPIRNKPRKLSGMSPVHNVRYVSGCTLCEHRTPLHLTETPLWRPTASTQTASIRCATSSTWARQNSVPVSATACRSQASPGCRSISTRPRAAASTSCASRRAQARCRTSMSSARPSSSSKER
jgi:transposase